jgi:hypothetical protein
VALRCCVLGHAKPAAIRMRPPPSLAEEAG